MHYLRYVIHSLKSTSFLPCETLLPVCSRLSINSYSHAGLVTHVRTVVESEVASFTQFTHRFKCATSIFHYLLPLKHWTEDYGGIRHFHTVTVDERQIDKMGRKNKNKQHGKNRGAVPQCQSSSQALHHPKNTVKTQHKIPSKISLVVVGTGGPGCSQSLLVTTEYSRYLFNCGDGTQRLATMSKGLRTTAYAKIAGLEHIFITHKSWENLGGLLGMTMTLEGQKNPEAKAYTKKDSLPMNKTVPHITIHGPSGVEKIAMMAKKFAVSANMNIEKSEGEFKDFAFTITPVPFYRNVLESVKDSGSEPNDCRPAPAKRQRRGSSTSPTRKGSAAFAYICNANPPIPKINVEKCYNAGVTIGPMVGKLQRGESVVLEDGRVVHPHDVTVVIETDTRPFLIMECPSLDFLPSLMACPPLQPFTQEQSDASFAVIAHMTPASVYNTLEYQSWMRKFHSSTDHLMINRDASEADLFRVREHQAKLNLVSEEIFPLLPESHVSTTFEQLGHKNDAQSQSAESEAFKKNLMHKRGQIVKACTGLHYVYRGKGLGFQIETEDFKVKEVQARFLETPEVQQELAVLRKTVPAVCSASVDRGEEEDDEEGNLTKYPKIVFLGTGSSEANRIRSQSCIVAQLSKHSVLILDCGEDSYGQMFRFFGKAKTTRLLRKLKAVFISHMHGDHHLGLFSVLKERKIAFHEKNLPLTPVLLMAPIQMRRWLKFYQTELESITDLFRFVRHQRELQEFDEGIPIQTATTEDIRSELNLTEYTPVSVEHCNNAFGVALTHANGFKLVYSGDTRPCDNLVKAGENCDLLIHEATHEDSLLENAKTSKHSTFSEAIEVGEKMKAKNIILTHFSQRYSHMVPFFNMTLPSNVGIAFDNMQVCPTSLKHLPKMIPLLTALFDEELQKLEIKNIKRLRAEQEIERKMSLKNSS